MANINNENLVEFGDNFSNIYVNRNDDQLNREELLKRKKEYVYRKLDNKNFGIFHVKALFITGIGFFTVIFLI